MSGPFNKRNFFGKHCVWAAVPGWSGINISDSETPDHNYTTLGQRIDFHVDEMNIVASASLTTEDRALGHLGKVRVLNFNPEGNSVAFRLSHTDNNEGIIFPNKRNLTILTIVKTGASNTPGSGDPRIFSKDTGTSEDDHDLMVGIASTGTEARTRIRLGAGTYTVLTTGGSIVHDGIQLIAGSVRDEGAFNRVYVHHLSEAGNYNEAGHLSTTAGVYNPRTTSAMAIGATAQGTGNAFEGLVIGVWAFDTAFFETDFREFFRNPWQVFKPQRILVPLDFVTTDADSAVVESTINSLVLSDTITPSDAAIALRVRNRMLADGITLSDALTIEGLCDEDLAPDALAAISGLQGVLSDVTADDASWLTI